MNSNNNTLKQIEEKKQIAYSKNIPSIIYNLYEHELRHYPAYLGNTDLVKIGWYNPKNKEAVPSLISDAIIEKNNKNEITKICLNNNVYKFSLISKSFIDPDRDIYYRSLLILLDKNDNKLLALNLSKENINNYKWQIDDIEAFIDGDWFKDFEKLHLIIEEKRKTRIKQYQKSKIEKMKKNFGIE